MKSGSYTGSTPVGSLAGSWRITAVEGDWVTVEHIRDRSTRLLKRHAAEGLLAGAKRNGLGSVRAKAAEAPKPIEPVPLYSLGNPAEAV